MKRTGTYKRRKPPKLTEYNLNVFRAIDYLQETTGFCPTVREIGKCANLSSPSTVWDHLYALRGLGLVQWVDGKARTIHIVADPS